MSEQAKTGYVPVLRFPEFREAGEWEQKKLSAVAELTSSKRVHLSDYVPCGIPFFRGKEISLLRNSQLPDDLLYISEEHYEELNKKYGVPQIGDILITAVGTLGNVYCVRNSDKFYFKDGNLIWMKNISENSIFLEILLNVKSEEVLSSAIGSSQKALTMVGLNKLEFRFPEKDEQQKIAACLTSLDELITAQAQKVETLKTHKKGLMQQLFPAEGETVPKLRFPEFREAGEWKNELLDNITIRGSGHTPNKQYSSYYNGGIKWVSLADSKRLDKGEIFETEIEISDEGIKNSSAVLHPKGSVLLSRDAGVGKSAVMASPMAVSQHFIVWIPKDGILSNWFLYNILQIKKKEFEHIAIGSTVKTIGLTYFKKLTILVPSLKEQQKIAACLFSLDELITAQTQKLAALKAHKKGLMQQLFPAVEELER